MYYLHSHGMLPEVVEQCKSECERGYSPQPSISLSEPNKAFKGRQSLIENSLPLRAPQPPSVYELPDNNENDEDEDILLTYDDIRKSAINSINKMYITSNNILIKNIVYLIYI